MSSEEVLACPRSRLPHAKGPIVRTSDDLFTIRCESTARHALAVSTKYLHERSVVPIPHPRREIFAPGGTHASSRVPLHHSIPPPGPSSV